MAHLVCVAHTRLELAEILVSFRKAGVENLLALGGDPPTDPRPGPGSSLHAVELVELARAIGGFSIGVAAHPAGHPPRPTWQSTGTCWRPSSTWRTSASPSSSSRPRSTWAWSTTWPRGACTSRCCPGSCRSPPCARCPAWPRWARPLPDWAVARLERPRPGAATTPCARPASAWPPSCARSCSRRRAGPALLHAQPLERDPGDLRRAGPVPAATRLGSPVQARHHGRQDHHEPDGTLQVPDKPIIPFIEGDGTGVDIWPAATPGLRRRRRQARQEDRLEGGPGRREGLQRDRRLAARRDRRGLPGAPHRHQGPAHHARSAAGSARSTSPCARSSTSTCACARCAGSTGRPLAGEAPREGRHGDLPGEHRGHLRRARGRGGHARGRAPARLPARRAGVGRSGPTRASGSSRSPSSAPSAWSAPPSTTRSSHDRKSVTLVHKGNIQKFTEGAFRNWGYELVREEFADVAVGWDDCGGEPGRQAARQGHHRRHHPAAGAHPARGLRRHRHDQPQRRLPLRRPGRPGGRHRHRAGRQHQLRHRPRHLRGHPRHGAQVRRARTRSTPAR